MFKVKNILITFLFCSHIFSVGEAGAVFLLIAPGAGAVGTGEAQVAKANDVYASYYNPAGLGYLNGSELSVMHVNWLPNLADDIYYDFLAYRYTIPNLGTFAANMTYLNLGEQIRTDEEGNTHGTFKSNMWALSTSFGSQITNSSSIGLGFKVIQQNLAPDTGAGSETTAGSATNILFDFGYLTKIFKVTEVEIADLGSTEMVKNSDFEDNRITTKRRFFTELNFGLSVSNIGPEIWFQDKGQADPAPTNMKLGIYSTLYNDKFNKLSVLMDFNKLLVARYPAMDWDGDGLIGNGEGNTVNSSGQQEGAYSDPWYKAIFTSWLDDWYFGGDYDLNSDGAIGGWSCGGTVVEESDGSYTCDGSSDNFLESDNGSYAFSEDDNKTYLEKGSGDSRKFSSEFKEMIYNMGVEYWYSNIFVIRAGYIYDYDGKISNPTFGAGLRFGQYGFDFGYTAGEQGHPRANTMFFSVNIGI